MLIEKLKALEPAQVRAFIEAVRQFWEYADLTTDQKLRRASLIP